MYAPETVSSAIERLRDTEFTNYDGLGQAVTSFATHLGQRVQSACKFAEREFGRKYGCPPDKQERATATVMQQAELLCADWAA